MYVRSTLLNCKIAHEVKFLERASVVQPQGQDCAMPSMAILDTDEGHSRTACLYVCIRTCAIAG